MSSASTAPTKKRKSASVINRDHAYARFWSAVSADELEELDRMNDTEIDTEIGNERRPIRSLPERNVDIPIDSTLVDLCPMAMRSALETTRTEWATIQSSNCCHFMNTLLSLDDQELSVRFHELFRAAIPVINECRNEKSLARQREILAKGLYRLQVSDTNWHIFETADAIALSSTERCHSTTMIVEFLLAHLFSLTKNEFANQSTPDIDQIEQQAIYYVGGYVVNKLLRILPSTSSLENEVREMLFLCAESESSYLPVASSWTTLIDRGRLVFINDYCYQVFMSVEKFARECTDGCPDYESALLDRDIDANVIRLASVGDISDSAQDMFKYQVVREFLMLRGKASAKSMLESALLNDELLQERRGLRSRLQRLETQRNE